MVENPVGPSELRLKRGLTVLQKARCLRDPETCSSWRSPLSSRSTAAASISNCENEPPNSNGVYHNGRLLELPSRSDSKCRKVYLYNWMSHSSKSSDNGTKLEEQKQESAEGSPTKSLTNHHKQSSVTEVPMKGHSIKARKAENSLRRTVKRPKRNLISRKRTAKHSALSKLHDIQSSVLANPVQQSDDTEYCDSEGLQQPTHWLSLKDGYRSLSASPLFSRSGCGTWSCSSRMLWNFKREESSHSNTPASTSSYSRCETHNPSAVESWDGTTASLDENNLDQLDLPGRQGCGIWSKRTKGRGPGCCYSASLSDGLKTRGKLCGSQILQHKRTSNYYKQKYLSKSSQGIPLLTNSCEGGGSSSETASDDLSSTFGGLDLEALSRLDGRRWSSCKSQEHMELALSRSADNDELNYRSLSQKYTPMSFSDIVGQSIVVHSLRNSVLRGRIAPAYLFQGPRGTGKTSAARIFAAALNCLSTEENRPCGFCRECTESSKGNGMNIVEVDAANQKDIDKMRYLLKNVTSGSMLSRYRVFIIDECHLLSTKLWSLFVKYMEEPPLRLVFIFVTIDPDNLPHSVISRCQKYLFPKIKDGDIVRRLRKISAEENLDVNEDALDLIALNSDGSPHDAETMLHQLSLLGKRITASLVNDLVGVVSDEKLLALLEVAMSSDTAETVKKSRELLESGLDPMALTSQLAGLIMDIIAGTYRVAHSQSSNTLLGGQSLTDAELERLQQALKVLSDAEKQLRLSCERSTWFTAALLQLSNGLNLEGNRSSSSSKQSVSKLNDGAADRMMETLYGVSPHLNQNRMKQNSTFISRIASGSPHGGRSLHSKPMGEHMNSDILLTSNQSFEKTSSLALKDDSDGERRFSNLCQNDMNEIWKRCINSCHSKTLKELLLAHGKLVSIRYTKRLCVAFLAFSDANTKSRAERFLSSITNSFEIVMHKNVEVRIGFLPRIQMEANSISPLKEHGEVTLENEIKANYEELNVSSNKDGYRKASSLPRKSLDHSDGGTQRSRDNCNISMVVDQGFQVASNPMFTERVNPGSNANCPNEAIPLQQHATPTNEQMMERAWLQATERSTSSSVNLFKPEKNQIWPQNGISFHYQTESDKEPDRLFKGRETKLNYGINNLKISDSQSCETNQQDGRLDHLAITPSLLRRNSFSANFDKDNLGYESGPGPDCNGLFCWNAGKAYNRKIKKGSRRVSRKSNPLSLFRECGRLRPSKSRLGR